MKNAVAVKARIGAFLTNRRIFLFAALLGFLIALPSLWAGLLLDDYGQRIIMLTKQDANPFEFYRMGSAQTEAQVQSGIQPWWKYPTSQLAFFRPVARWLMQVDYQLWPDSIWLMHLHSVLWYAALVAAVGLVYRRFTPVPIAAGFSAILFAVDAWHGGAVAWLANRNVLVAMTGSMLALLCYERRQWYWQLLGCLIFALTMACAEAALAITGYFFAYEVFLSKQRWPQRILRLLPYALIVVLWFAFWRRYGYGSAGPGFYTDPATNPLGFLQNMTYRLPAILFGQFALVAVEIFGVIESTLWRPYALAGALIAVLIFVRLLWPLLQSSAQARFYALGMLIAAIPICGVQLVNRSLWYVGFGALGVLGLLFERFFFAQVKPKKSLAWFTGVMLFLHFVVSPISFVIGIKAVNVLDSYFDARTFHLPDAGAANKKTLAIATQNYELNIMFPLMKDKELLLDTKSSEPQLSIAKVRALTNGPGEFELWRKDDDTLVVRRDSGFEKMREGRYGFNKGDSVVLDDVAITVREINSNREATEIEYRFKSGALNNYEVVTWGGNYFVPAQLPEIGMKTIVKVLPPS